MKRTLGAVAAFGVAFGFVEAVVVVYLRLQYYPRGFAFPLAAMPDSLVFTEVAREAATIVMLAATGWLAGQRFLTRFAYFAFAFGVWDIFYYVFLKVILDWPASVLTWDVLFLIPLPWLAPVLAPVIVSACLIGASVVVLFREQAGTPVAFTALQWLFMTLGGILVIVSFLMDQEAMLRQQLPQPFVWPLFGAGMLIGIGAFLWGIGRGSKTITGA